MSRRTKQFTNFTTSTSQSRQHPTRRDPFRFVVAPTLIALIFSVGQFVDVQELKGQYEILAKAGRDRTLYLNSKDMLLGLR